MTSIEEKRQQRTTFMRALHEATGGDHGEHLDSASVCEAAGIPSGDRRALIDFLEGEYLIKTHRSASGYAFFVQIEHAGVVEVEEALAEPERPTEHFAAINSITILGNVSGSQIGAAGGDLTQTATFNGSQTDSVRAWLDEYRAALHELDDGVRVIADQQLAQVGAEVEKPEPHPAIVNGLLSSLKTFAQNGIAAAGAGAGTMGLAEVVAHWPL